MPLFEILCLANSRKHAGRCVAGLRTDGGGWVRPVSASDDGTLHYPAYALAERGYAQLLDVIRVPVAGTQPRPHQPENWLLGPGTWRLVARPGGRHLLPIVKAAICRGPELLGGTADRVPAAHFAARPASASLALVAPAEVHWHIAETPSGERRVRAEFALRGTRYCLGVTDPLWEERLRRLAPGRHAAAAAGAGPPQRLLLTISLGEPYNDACYKLVAGVAIVPTEWGPPSHHA